MAETRNEHDDPWRVVAWMIAGQALCMAAGFALLPNWLLAPARTSSRLGVFLLLTVGASFVLLVAGLWQLRKAARDRQAKHDEADKLVRDDLVRTQQAVMFGLAHLSESRDPMTGQHLLRMKQFTRELASALSHLPQYRPLMTSEFIHTIEMSAMLHDIGKVGVPDSILQKPAELTLEERREMEQHPLISSECLSRIEKRLGASNFLQMAHEIALYHHERWDGLGYPHGLRGAAIPLSARIVAIADVYDALSSARVYKPAFPHSQCVEMIRLGAGTQFDPELVQVFLSVESRFAEISRQLSDTVAATTGAAGTSASSPPLAGRPDDRSFDDLTSELNKLDALLTSLGVDAPVGGSAPRELTATR